MARVIIDQRGIVESMSDKGGICIDVDVVDVVQIGKIVIYGSKPGEGWDKKPDDIVVWLDDKKQPRVARVRVNGVDLLADKEPKVVVKEVIKEVIKPVEVVKEVEVIKEVIKEVYVDRPVVVPAVEEAQPESELSEATTINEKPKNKGRFQKKA